MLQADEFTVGTLADAKPLSLVLPIRESGETFLVGNDDNNVPVAVFLKGKNKFQAFTCNKALNWDGIIIPAVYIEIDETRNSSHNLIGSVIRIGTKISVKTEMGEYGRSEFIILKDGLTETLGPSGMPLRAIFTKWQICLGAGQEKRILFSVDVNEKS